ncbi:hypothetical protein [Natronosalvus halobius]|uniref:hypothetical protein n=1 Tax=Natronosalvus halobius TaxID=2953746 RepID=UPI00209E3508|nr:hypothetical protein [Natronosalvus halobius]USZ70813.1 hypothetical protein NGM15_11975 [Natronosalvus halobius]
MAPERRLEYERSSAPPASSDDGAGTNRRTLADERDEATSGIGVARSKMIQFVDRVPQYAKIGSLTGVTAFVVVYLVAYQLTLATRSGMTPAEGEPGVWVYAGIVTLVSHGGTLAQEPEGTPYLMIQTLQIGPMFLVPTAILVLVTAGAVVGRYFESETITEIAVAVSAASVVYVGALSLLTRFARYSLEAADSNIRREADIETIAIGLDLSFLLTSIVLVLAFTSLGALLARSWTHFAMPSRVDTDSSEEEPSEGDDPGELAPRSRIADETSSLVTNGEPDGEPHGEHMDDAEARSETAKESPPETGQDHDHDRYKPDDLPSESADGHDRGHNRNRDRGQNGDRDRNHDRYRPSDD